MKHKLSIGLLVLAIGVSSCGAPTDNNNNADSSYAESVRAWFDAPLPNSVFLPPSPCQIVAHGASPNGIALFELSVNGAATSLPSPDTQSSLVPLTRDCGLTEPGEYQLLLRAQDNNGSWSGFAETSLIIVGGETPTPTSSAIEPPAITPTPTPAPAGGVSIERVSTNLVYLGRADCGPLEITITARATATKGITAVVLFYRFSSASSEFQSVAMNPIGGDLYQRSLNPTSLLGGSVPFDQATLQYQIVIQQNDGDTSLRTPVMADIVVQACGSAVSSCSSYVDERTCIAKGCTWVTIPGIVPSFACQNP